MGARVEVWPAGDGWRWREWAANGRIVSESGEAYTRKGDAHEAAERENPGAVIEVTEGEPDGRSG